MRLPYYPETDSLYIEFRDGPETETIEVAGLRPHEGSALAAAPIRDTVL